MLIARRELLLGGLSAGAATMAAACANKPMYAVASAPGPEARAPRATAVIDMHAHFYPPEWLALVEKEGPANGVKVGTNDKGWRTLTIGDTNVALSPAHTDVATRLQRMDEQGVDVQALSLSLPMVAWAPPALGLKLAQVFNDACSAAHTQHPKRYAGTVMLPMQAPDLALQELERASKLPGMRALYLATNVLGKNLDDKSYLPVFAKCHDLGWPVLLHPVDPVGAERMRSYYLRNLLGNPYDTGIAAASLVFGGVMDSFPRLEVVLPHGGGAFPALIGRLDHGTEVRPELQHMKQPASAYLRRFHYDTILHSPTILSNLIRQVGADRVVVGSDYPFDMGYPKPVEVVERLSDVTPSDRELILGKNAARLLKL
jgi:aminocarboxymuconate-semialdehyde decarboxylase